jgi:ribonuclease P protein subunit POP4
VITPRNVASHELTGLHVLVVDAFNPLHTTISGQVIDETRNLLVILTNGGVKRVQKVGTVFQFTLPDGSRVDVEGKVLAVQPERRINIRLKK